MWARVISGIIGVFMMFTAFNWLLDPTGAAAGLSLCLKGRVAIPKLVILLLSSLLQV